MLLIPGSFRVKSDFELKRLRDDVSEQLKVPVGSHKAIRRRGCAGASRGGRARSVSNSGMGVDLKVRSLPRCRSPQPLNDPGSVPPRGSGVVSEGIAHREVHGARRRNCCAATGSRDESQALPRGVMPRYQITSLPGQGGHALLPGDLLRELCK
jgi:hypothetical protein